MKRIFLLFIALLGTHVYAADTLEKGTSGSPAQSQISYNNQRFDLIQDIREQTVQESEQELQKKSGFKAALFSAILPGSGEFYAESYWKSAIFAAIEVAGWVSYLHYESEGDRKDKIMRELGDDRWDEQRYWSDVYQRAVEAGIWEGESLDRDNLGVITDDYYTSQNIARIRALETSTSMPAYFTHSLPETKTQQYYEMIYKYLRQFGSGWVELQELGLDLRYYANGDAALTPDVARYKKTRNQSNDFYSIASTAGKIILFNHLVSALDAAFSVKSYNNAIQYSLYSSQRYYAGEYVNTYGIALSW